MKNKKLSLKIVIALLLSVILITLSFSYLVFSSNSLSYDTYVQPGSMATETAYIIFTDGSTHYARNGLTGTIDFSDTDASDLIKAVVDTVGGSREGFIHIRAADYEIDSTIVVDKEYVQICGDGCGETTTRLILSSGSNCNMFNLSAATFFQLKNIRLDGNRGYNTAGTGVFTGQTPNANATADVRIDHCFIHDFPEYGVYFTDAWGLVITDSYIEGNGKSGGYFSTWHYMVDKTTFNYNQENGMYIGGVGHMSVTECMVCDNHQHGIEIGGSVPHVTIADNLIKGNSQNGSNQYNGIDINAQYITIRGNTIDGNGSRNNVSTILHHHNIYVETGGPVSILGNTIRNSVASGIKNEYGVAIDIRFNPGFQTSNAAALTFPNAQTSYQFTHSFSITPTHVDISWRENIGNRSWWYSADATYITVYLSVAAAQDYNFTYAAIYRP